MESPKQDFNHSLRRVDGDEKLLAVIKRHPFGIIKLYVQLLVALATIGGLVFLILPDLLSGESNGGAFSMAGGIIIIIATLMLLIAFVATIIYGQNQLVVTDKTITQTLQVSLFSKKISQLAVSNIEDVTADTNGFFQTILNYGKLLVETAGEQENFHFEYCPHADHYAKLILETRQAFLSHRELDRQESGQRYLYEQQQASYAQPQQPPQAAPYQQPAGQPYTYSQAPVASGPVANPMVPPPAPTPPATTQPPYQDPQGPQ